MRVVIAELGNDAAVPDCHEQIVFADHPFAIVDQVRQEVEDLGLYGNQTGSATQLALVGVEGAISE